MRASDWHSHGHDSDPAYHSVVLHVVEQDDTPILRPNGETIPQVVMPCAADFANIYDRMVRDPLSELPCARHIVELEGIYITDWLTRLAFERLGEKADRILGYLDRAGGDWGRPYSWHWHARSASAPTATPSGWWPSHPAAQTHAPLRLPHKHRGCSLRSGGFSTLSLPMPQPTLRAPAGGGIHLHGSQIRAATAGGPGLENGPNEGRTTSTPPSRHPRGNGGRQFSIGYNITSVSGVEEARRLFDIELSGYWAHRFNFGEPACRTTKALSDSSVNILLINVTAPVLYAYGIRTGRPESCVLATEILQALPPEDNSIIRIFTATGISCNDALTSQAMIQLRNQYCRPRKCLYCRIGHRYFAQKLSFGLSEKKNLHFIAIFNIFACLPT